MNKIIIVGHPDSGHAQVENLLFRCGMKNANPSRRDRLTPHEVIASICKAISLPDIDEITNQDLFGQHTPGPVWDGLVLDLMLGNLEHELWGWADSQALFLLEYLQGLDPQMTFVLVYNDPQSVLLKPLHDHQNNATEKIFEARLDRWTSYNSALLHFFLQNNNRCILVHADGVQLAAEQYLSMLQSRLSAPLQVPEDVDGEKLPVADLEGLSCGGSQELTEAGDLLSGNFQISAPQSDLAAEDFLAKAAESFIINQYLRQHSACQQIYAEMQASSNFPFVPDTASSTSAEAAWTAFLKQRLFASELVGRIHEDRQKSYIANQELAEEQSRLRQKIRSTNEELASRATEWELNKSELEQASADQKTLVEQLEKNLARRISESEDLEQQVQRLTEEQSGMREMIRSRDEERESRVIEWERHKSDLERRSTELKTLAVQLEKDIAERIAESEDLKQQVQQQSEEQLSVREITRLSEEGLVSRTTELEQNEFEMEKRIAELNTHIEQLEKSLAACISESEKLQQQVQKLNKENLSLRELIQSHDEEVASCRCEIQRQNDYNGYGAAAQKLLIEELRNTQQEMEGLILERIILENPAEPPAPTGAAERVKAQLSYRLGIIMTQQSKSISGLLHMPFMLLEEKKDFSRRRIESQREILPPLYKYADVHLAERVKSQLSYRLGSVLVHNSKSFYGWLSLPLAILHQTRLFNKQIKIKR